MSRKHLKRDPQHVRGQSTWWWYEESGGVMIYLEGIGHVGSISWARIRAALKRKDKKP